MQKIKTVYTHNNSLVRIILDDGKGNVLDSVTMRELQELLNTFKENNNLKLITFEGAGKHFSFGASVEEHTKDKAPAMLKQFHNLFYTIIDLSIPTLAKISGQCLGGGFELALICNFMYADKSAKMGVPEIMLGVFPPPASLLLPLKINPALAEEMILTGKVISVDEGKNIGLLNDVFEDKETLEAGIDEWFTKNMMNKSASSLRYAVKASRANINKIMKETLPGIEEMYVNKLMGTNDANEGINSFLEKRKPEWKNS